jgi:hypothetical protein
LVITAIGDDLLLVAANFQATNFFEPFRTELTAMLLKKTGAVNCDQSLFPADLFHKKDVFLLSADPFNNFFKMKSMDGQFHGNRQSPSLDEKGFHYQFPVAKTGLRYDPKAPAGSDEG